MFKQDDVIVWKNPNNYYIESLEQDFRLYKVIEVIDNDKLLTRQVQVQKGKPILCYKYKLNLPHPCFRPLNKLTKAELINLNRVCLEDCRFTQRDCKPWIIKTTIHNFLDLYSMAEQEELREQEEAKKPIGVGAELLRVISALPKSNSMLPSLEHELVLKALSGERESRIYWGESNESEKQDYMDMLRNLGFSVEDEGGRIYFSW